MDPLRIAECWVVRTPGVHGTVSSVELLTTSGRFGGFLTPLGVVGPHAAEAWEDLAWSWPDL